MILAQISDPHLRVGPGDAGSAQALEAAVDAVNALDPLPDAVLLSGDLTDHATADEYQRVAELLEPLSMPVHLLAGNHDDPDEMRAHLGAPGKPGEPLQYTQELGPLRLIACDTTIRGRDDGALGGCPVFACASSYLQLVLDLRPASEIFLVREPPVFGLHVMVGADLISHVVPIGDHGPPFRLP